MIAYETRIGTVNISNSYFSKLIGKAVSSCYGVAGMVAVGKQRLLQIVSNMEYADKGIRIRGNMDSIIVELHIIVTYGMNINAIAKSIINKVKYTVQESTGIEVEKVVVRIDGIKE